MADVLLGHPVTSAVFLDLYRVLADPDWMQQQYRRRMADILQRRYGVPIERGLRIHDESYDLYTQEGERLDAMHMFIGHGEKWVEAVQNFEANNIKRIFAMAGLPPPDDPIRFAPQLEEEIVLGADAIYPDVRPALKEMKAEGHRIFMSTNATRSNAESALIGGGIRDMFDNIIVMEVAESKKDRPHYWKRTFEYTGVCPAEAVVVDDVVSYLDIAGEMGMRGVQLIRPEYASLPRGRWPIIESLAELPPLLRKL